MKTVLKTVSSSKANWSCRKTAILSLFPTEISPRSGWTSPDSILRKVDLPAPLAPISP